MSTISEHKEKYNLKPLEIKGKETYYHDLFNIEHSWTGRLDAQIANTFILEANQLLVNSIVLFEQGYFDCAFYSLRQSLEVSTTMTYLVDNDETKRESLLNKWKSQGNFPMYGQMVKFLEENESIFSDIKTKMSEYFEELNFVKKKLNKYVHKQGFQTFYISRNHPLNQANSQENFIAEFEKYLQKCIGAVAVLRLTIDPFPVLLSDENMYSRTGDSMTKSYSDEFISKYIGTKYIDSYKTTDLYVNHYEGIIQEEAKNPCVADVVKNQYIDKTQIDKILEQKHLLSKHELIAVNLCSLSEKISKIYSMNGLLMYFTNVDTNRKKWSWSGEDFMIFKTSETKFNQIYDEAFISCIETDNEIFWIEHNEIFEDKEVEKVKNYTQQ